MFTVNDLIDIAIKMEKNGEALYLASRQKVLSRQLKSLLQWMAEEEAAHCEWFADKKGKWTSDAGQTDLETMLPDVIKEMMGEKTLSLDDVDFSRIRSAGSLLETFMNFEKDTILFYEFLQAFVNDSTALKGLKKIIEEEKKHVAELKEMIRAIAQKKVREQTIEF
ncbi:MAG: ferritin family protein [Desulfotignum sp.]|nr:ferritin family protein [Desulfotignum sp.]